MSPADVSPELWVPGFAEWLAKEKGASGGTREASSLGAFGLTEPLAGMTLQSGMHQAVVWTPPPSKAFASFYVYYVVVLTP